MKLFVEEGVSDIVYDAALDQIYDEAISCLLKTKGNWSEASKESEKRDVLKRVQKNLGSLEEQDIRRYRKLISNLLSLERDDYAIGILKDLVGPEEKNLLKDGQFQEVHKRIISPPGLLQLTATPGGFCLCMVAGYSVDVNAGITNDLKGQNLNLYNFLHEVWDNAVKELHPFQRGHTHQGTKHCGRVLSNLETLMNMKTFGINFPIGVWGMLSIATALHDMGKADIIPDPPWDTPPATEDKHAENGAKLIQKNSNDIFKLNAIGKDGCDFVAEIVDRHNPEQRLNIIDNVNHLTISSSLISISLTLKEKQQICALFQLSDVMDITKDRVSDSLFEILKEIYFSLKDGEKNKERYNNVKKMIDARRGIASFNPEPRTSGTPAFIRVQKSSICSSDKNVDNSVDEGIKRENKDLEDTGAATILENEGWPRELKL